MIDDFKQEVTNNRPRMALVYLVPVIEELLASNKALAQEVENLKSQLNPKTEAPSTEPEEKTPAEPEKKAPVKKRAPRKSAAKKKTPAKAKKEAEATDAG